MANYVRGSYSDRLDFKYMVSRVAGQIAILCGGRYDFEERDECGILNPTCENWGGGSVNGLLQFNLVHKTQVTLPSLFGVIVSFTNNEMCDVIADRTSRPRGEYCFPRKHNYSN